MAATTAALVFCILLGGLAVFQLTLVMGAPLGRFAWGGAHERLPSRLRVGSLLAIVIYAVFAIVALERAGLASLLPSPALAHVGAWVVAAYLAVGVVMNAVSRSRPEQLVMTPVAAALCALALLLALSPAA